MKTITVSCEKGGVGKTTTAVTLAHGLALKGKQVLLIDLDPQGQCATALDVPAESGVFTWLVAGRPLSEVVRVARQNLSLIPGDTRTAYVQMLWAAEQKPVNALALALKPISRIGKLDYVVIDTSPSVGGMQERALYAADLVIIPAAVDYLSADAVAKTVRTMETNRGMGWNGALMGVLPTFFDGQTIESRVILDELRQAYPGQVLNPIYRRTIMRQCVSEGKTIWEMDGSSKSGQEYADLLYRVLEV